MVFTVKTGSCASKLSFRQLALMTVFIGLLSACSSNDGGDGTNGSVSLINIIEEPAGDNCADGGQRVDSGIDDNADGILDTSEADVSSYICRRSGSDGANGSDGTNGSVSLISA